MQCAKSFSERTHGVVCDISAHDRWSSNPFNYVFSHFCGIALTSLVTLLSYVAVRREKAFLPRNIMGPSVLSGVMWGIAQAAWFEANERLSAASVPQAYPCRRHHAPRAVSQSGAASPSEPLRLGRPRGEKGPLNAFLLRWRGLCTVHARRAKPLRFQGGHLSSGARRVVAVWRTG